MTLLWHAARPIGICLFTSPPLSLRQRNRYFGLSGRWSRIGLRALNAQLVNLSRVVLHPTYRGAGLAQAFVRRSCESAPWPWIETLAQMGHVNPFFEKAGFTRVGVTRPRKNSIADYSVLYGDHSPHGKRLVTPETHRKSRYARPVYYVFDNRRQATALRGPEEAGRPG